MHIAKFAGLLFVSVSVVAAAQVSPFSVEGGQVVRRAAPACPLDMHVRQAGGGRMIATDKNDGRLEMVVEARLKLLLSDRRQNKSDQKMVKATVTVHGWDGKDQVLPVGATREQNGEAKMALTVPLTGGGVPDASADLNLPGFTAARMVELESITFEDGQVWSFSGSSACRVAPDPFLPVDVSK